MAAALWSFASAWLSPSLATSPESSTPSMSSSPSNRTATAMIITIPSMRWLSVLFLGMKIFQSLFLIVICGFSVLEIEKDWNLFFLFHLIEEIRW